MNFGTPGLSSSNSDTTEKEGSSNSDENNFFGVKKIIDVKLENGLKYFKVQWVDSWEPEHNLLGCTDLIKEFLDTQKDTAEDDSPDRGTGKDKKRKDQQTNEKSKEKKRLNELDDYFSSCSDKTGDSLTKKLQVESLSIKTEDNGDNVTIDDHNTITAKKTFWPESSSSKSSKSSPAPRITSVSPQEDALGVEIKKEAEEEEEEPRKKRTAKITASFVISRLYEANQNISSEDEGGSEKEDENASDDEDDDLYQPPPGSDHLIHENYIANSPELSDFDVIDLRNVTENSSSANSSTTQSSTEINPIDFLQKNFPTTVKPPTSTMLFPRFTSQPHQATTSTKEKTSNTSHMNTIIGTSNDSNFSTDQLQAQALLLSKINKANLDPSANPTNVITPGLVDDECMHRLRASLLYKIPIKYLQNDCIELLLSHIIFYVVKFIKEMYLEPGELKPDKVQELIAKGAVITVKDNYKLEDLQEPKFLEAQINDLTQIAVKYLPYDKLMGMLYTYAVRNVNRTLKSRKNFFPF